jgi:phosphopantetheine adenylyltransferase
MAGYGGGGNGGIHTLYGVTIDKAVQSNDVNKMKEVLKVVRQYFHDSRPHVLYGVVIKDAIGRNASREELQGLLAAAKETRDSDLDAAIQTLEQHLGGATATT